MSANALRHKWKYHMLSIDMSRAFDTIDRRRLLTVMDNIVGLDEMHMLRLLLLDTSLAVRVGQATSKLFSNTTGTLQGDGLSRVLFTCSLAAALKDTKHRLPIQPQADAHIPHETEYADDVIFYSTSTILGLEVMFLKPDTKRTLCFTNILITANRTTHRIDDILRQTITIQQTSITCTTFSGFPRFYITNCLCCCCKV